MTCKVFHWKSLAEAKKDFRLSILALRPSLLFSVWKPCLYDYTHCIIYQEGKTIIFSVEMSGGSADQVLLCRS